MHDIKLIRNDPQQFHQKLLIRKVDVDVERILEMDVQQRALIGQLDEMRQLRNSLSKKVGSERKSGKDTTELQAEIRVLGTNIKDGEVEEKRLSEQIRDVLLDLPNLPSESTPIGANETENVVISKWGKIPTFEFELQDHLSVAERLNILDFKRGGKITGSGFPVWSGAGAKLERALINFMLDLQTGEHGYREMMTPLLSNRESMLGTGQIPHLEDDMYLCEKDDLFLIPTSETMLVNLHRSEIIPEEDLPIRYAAYTPCFRREAGSWGKDTRGFQRTHQFNKIEMVRIERPEKSEQALKELIQHATEVLKRLELPYRLVQLCSGDLPFQASTCYDLEVWAPADGGRWLEVSSCSDCDSFQARRASIRYRNKDGKVDFVHTLNGSGLATSRVLVALIESYQTEEGSLAIPPVLRPYMNDMSVIMADQ